VRGGLAAAIVLGCLFAIPSTQPKAASLSSRDEQAVRSVVAAGNGGGDWSRVPALAAGTDHPATAKLLRWLYLLKADSGPSFEELTRFVVENPSWPGLKGLRSRAEAAIRDDLDSDAVRAWFKRYPPLTGAGMARYVAAASGTGEQAAVADRARAFWTNAEFTEREQANYLDRLGGVLRPRDHQDRLDRLLWEGESEQARRMLPLVDDGQRALANARLALAARAPEAEGALARVPESLRGDQGLLYARVRWLRRADRTDAAIALLNSAPRSVERAELWWGERQALARRLMEERLYAAAYRLVAAHRQTEGIGYTQAEFLAGWLALTQLKRPRQAYGHFQSLYSKVTTPLSLSRGAYWSARAAEADGNTESANRWYKTAAGFPTTFYGQLAAEALGLDRGDWLPAPLTVSSAASARFEDRELVRAIRLLDRASTGDRRALLAPFLTALAGELKSAEEFTAAAHLAEEVHLADSAVTIAKKAQSIGRSPLILAGYPVAPVPRDATPEPPFVLALIRQESQFNAEAVSRAGARGLMQLMPATARAVAKKAGEPYTPDRLTDDPGYNVRLGTQYLSEMLDRFGGSMVLAAAAYNGGPGRVGRWVQTMGDPRQLSALDVVDWIEQIPIYETRDYVQRVLEGTQVYRARLGAGSGGSALNKDLVR